MNAPLKFIATSIFTAISLSSCVQQSKYDIVCNENFRLQEQVKDLISVASQKDTLIKELQAQLEDAQPQISDSSTINKDKGKDELNAVGVFFNERANIQGYLASTRIVNSNKYV